MRLFVVRHGESLANVDLKEYQNTPNCLIGLTELGIQQAHVAGKLISAEINDNSIHEHVVMYSSLYRRATQTTDIIRSYLHSNIKQMEDALLIEQNYGSATGFESTFQYFDQGSEIEKSMYFKMGNFFSRLPSGESKADVAMRAEIFLTKVLQFKHIKDIIAVSHKCFCYMLHKQILGQYDEEFEWKNGEVRVYQTENNSSNPLLWSFIKTL